MTSPGPVRPQDIWLVAVAIGLSAAGDFIALIALGLRANEMHADGIGVAAIFIALWAPIAVLAGYVGLIVDRFETTRLLAFVSAGQAVVAVVLGFTTPFGLLLLFTAVLGAGVAVSQSAEFALVPDGRGDAERAVGERDRRDGPLRRLRRRAAGRWCADGNRRRRARDARRRSVVRRRRRRRPDAEGATAPAGHRRWREAASA